MYIKNVFLLCFSIHCFAADQKPAKSMEYDPKHLGAYLAILYVTREFTEQRTIRTAISETVVTDTDGRQGALFAYTPEQRAVAYQRQQGASLGLVSMVGLIINPHMPINIIKGISAHSVMGQVLAPMVVYNQTKQFLDKNFVYCHSLLRVGVGGAAACTIPRLFIGSGMSPERMILNAVITHMLTHQHNMYRNSGILGRITGSLEYSSMVVPAAQAVMSRYSSRATMFTVHPVMNYGFPGINLQVDCMHGIVPILVHAGVDLTFNALATTSFGKAIENRIVDPMVNTVVKPLPEKVQRPVAHVTKKTLTESAKFGATYAALNTGCTIV